MKKIFVILGIALLSAGAVSAQNFESATNKAKEANEALVADNAQAALDGFLQAKAEAEQCGDEGAAELVESCKQGITLAQNKLANDLIDAGKLKEAIAQLEQNVKTAEEFGMEEAKTKAAEKIQQLYQAIASSEIKAAATDKENKAAHFAEANNYLDLLLAAEPDNGKAWLQKGQVNSALGKKDIAIAAFEKAKEFGLEKDAIKQLSNIFVKEASGFLKGGKYKEAIASALKSAEYRPNANAYKIAGVASQKAGDLKGAVEYLSKYLEINPNDAQIKAAVDALKARAK